MTDLNFPVPMYFRIQQAISERIQQGELKPGDQLPTEAKLAKQYLVSRITAKRALDELVRNGSAYRQQGKGTFVAQSRIRDISGYGSFTEDMKSRGLTASTQVLEKCELSPTSELNKILKLEPGERIYLLKRLRKANFGPVAVESAYLPVRLCKGLLEQDLEKSLYIILQQKYQVVPTWAEAEFETRFANDDEAKLLEMVPHHPVLVAHRITYSANYDIIEAVTSVYRGDRFTFYSGRQLIG